MWRGFGSDNQAGAHPEVIEALVAANEGHAHGYGEDPWTEQAIAALKRHFGDACDVVFTCTGTGANCVALAAVCRPWEAVICAESAHIMTDEAGAPERTAGVKLVPVSTSGGKLAPDLVRPHLAALGFVHAAQPRVVSISNVTERGTVYTAREIEELADLAHAHGLLVHCDGARLANAAVAQGASLAELTVDAGVDVLSLGGTKNGLLFGEAVLLFGRARTSGLRYVHKQLGQLASKMRFIAAQFTALYGTDLWRRCAGNANAMAARLAAGLRAAGVTLTEAPEANEVFALLPAQLAQELAERFRFYVWAENASPGMHEVRLVTSWDTTEDDVDAFLDAVTA